VSVCGPGKNGDPIAVGEGDVELAMELAAKRRGARRGVDLMAGLPPVAQAVYVCKWCTRIVDRCSLNWCDQDGGQVCDGCAEEFFTLMN